MLPHWGLRTQDLAPRKNTRATPKAPWPTSPVSGNLNIQSHLDIEQVLIFSELGSHLPLGVPQLGVQLLDSFLRRRGHIQCQAPATPGPQHQRSWAGRATQSSFVQLCSWSQHPPCQSCRGLIHGHGKKFSYVYNFSLGEWSGVKHTRLQQWLSLVSRTMVEFLQISKVKEIVGTALSALAPYWFSNSPKCLPHSKAQEAYVVDS